MKFDGRRDNILGRDNALDTRSVSFGNSLFLLKDTDFRISETFDQYLVTILRSVRPDQSDIYVSL